RAVGVAPDDLPVAARHAVPAHVDGAPIDHAHPPVVVGRHELLRHDQLRLRQGFAHPVTQILLPVDLGDAGGEARVRQLQHYGDA
ncbi:hypothetical protein DF186_20065, partial [Enterococcus hirae]